MAFIKYSVILLILIAYTAITPVHALYDPTSVPNNKLGVHILHPSEIGQAKDLVNSNGGDWGYVTVPIQPADRDLDKWQTFMHEAKNAHLIPIVRITTIPNGGTWDSAKDSDLVDFANFLNELDWPTENRYIILFNEVNQSREWGGSVSPAKYTEIIKNSRIIFKERSEDFFLLGPALDDALPDSTTSMSAKKYLAQMVAHDQSVWSYFDGIAMHSYPNPGFIQPPKTNTFPGITSYNYIFNTFKLADKPVFITETGWDQTKLSDQKIKDYWQSSWDIWNKDKRVVAVTPFVLNGGAAFPTLSLKNEDGSYSKSALALLDIQKSAGEPKSAPEKQSKTSTDSSHLSGNLARSYKSVKALRKLENIIRVIFGLPVKSLISVGGSELVVELAQNPKQWEKGLSDRTELVGVDGMLFVFPEYHIPTFWMKDTHIPLDIIWIKDNVITEIAKDVPVAETKDLPLYSPKNVVDSVLEVQAGYSDLNNLSVGDKIYVNNY